MAVDARHKTVRASMMGAGAVRAMTIGKVATVDALAGGCARCRRTAGVVMLADRALEAASGGRDRDGGGAAP